MLDAVRHPDAALPSHADAFLTPMESLIGAIRAAGPQGMEKARDRFATDLDNVLATRLELLCGAHLAWRQIPFGFGARGEPDLVWNASTAQEAWLEVHRRDVDAFSTLQRTISTELAPKGATLTIRLGDWPLKVPNRNGVLRRVSDAADRAIATGEEQTVVIPELGSGAMGVVARENVPFSGSGRVTVQHHGPLLSPSDDYRQTVAGKLKEKIERDKSSQAREGSWSPRTALLIDISAARQMRALESRDLAGWLDGVPIDWDEHPFASVAICFTDLHSVSLTGACRYKPDLDAAARECLEPTLTAIGLPPTHP
jgi:hypothetical protein